MANQKVQYTLAFTADTKQAKAQLASLQNQLTGLINSATKGSGSNILSKDIQEASAAAAQLKAQLLGATNVNTGKLDLTKFSRSLKASGMELKDYRDALLTLGPQGAQTFANLASSITQAEVPLVSMNAKIRELGTTLANTVKWQISSSAVHAFMGTIQGAYGYAQDLNKSLNDIRIVTGRSSDEMARFAKQANDAAKALSTSTTKYTEAALIYYQQGLTDEQVKARTDTTIKMANVTGENAADVSSYMTAIWNNFAKGSDNLEYFSDVITALGAATAASSAEIAGGLEKFAAVGETVGLSYEYATAALTTIIDKTRQSEDVVGTALKTIFARIQGLQQGDTTDDGVTLNKYSSALANVGIQVIDANGNLKEMDEILDEMGEKWEKLSKAEQVALAQTVGGTRQYTQLIALMDNWDSMQQNISIARNSEGSLQEQADIYAESWEAAQKRVTAALQDIYDSLLNDKFFIGLTNMFAEILELLGNLIDSMGGAAGLIGLIGAIGVKVFGTQLAGGLQTTINFFKNGRKEAEKMRESAVKLVSTMHSGMANAEGFEAANAYRSQALAQQEFLNATKDLNEEQRKTVQILLDQHSLLVQNALEESKRAEELGEKSNQAKRKEASERRAEHNELLKMATPEEAKKLEEDFNKKEDEIRKNFEDIEKNAYNKSFISNSIGKFRYDKEGEKEDAMSWMEGFKKNYGFNTKGEETDPFENFKNTSGILDNDVLIQKIKALDDAITNNGNINAAVQDLEDYGAALNDLPKNATPAEQALHDYAEAQAKAGTKSIEAAVGIDTIKNKLSNFTKAAATAVDKAVQAAGGLGSIASGLSSIMSLGETWSEDNDASVFSKLLSSITTLGFALPMVSGGLKSLAVSLAGATAEGLTTTGAISALWGALLPLLANPVTWVILGIAGALALVYLEATKEERALKKANKQLEKSREAANQASEAYNKLKTSVDSLKDAQKTLSGLTEGTREWKEAVLEVNQKVLDLIKLYPELAKYVSSKNGVLTVDEKGLDEAIDNQIKKVDAANAVVLSDQENVAQKEKDLYVDEGKTWTYTETYQKQYQTGETRTDFTDGTQNDYGWYTDTRQVTADANFLSQKTNELDEEGLLKYNTDTKKYEIDYEKMNASGKTLADFGLNDQTAKIITDNVDYLREFGLGLEAANSKVDVFTQTIADNWVANNKKGLKDEEEKFLTTGLTNESSQFIDEAKDFYKGKNITEEFMAYSGMTEKEIKDAGYTNEQMENVLVKNKSMDLTAERLNQVLADVRKLPAYQNLSPEAKQIVDNYILSGGDPSAIDTILDESVYDEVSGFVTNKNNFTGSEDIISGTDTASAEKLFSKDKEKYFADANKKDNENYQTQMNNLASEYNVDMDGIIHAQETFANKLGITKEQLKDTSKLTKEQRKELADLTKQYFETYKNVKKLSEVMEDNADILNNKSLKGTVEYDEALENVTKAVEKVTGAKIPTSLTEKLWDEGYLQKAIDGNLDAMKYIYEQSALYQLTLLPEVSEEDLANYQNIIKGIYDGTLDVNSTVVQKFVEDLREMLVAAGWTTEQIQGYFDGIGLDVEMTEIKYSDLDKSQIDGHTITLNDGTKVEVPEEKWEAFKEGTYTVPTKVNSVKKKEILAPKAPSGGGKKGGGSSKKEKKKAKDELNKFREEERALSTLEKQLDRISKAKDRAYGKDKLKKMDEEIAKYEELAKAQQKLIDEVKTDYDEKRAAAVGIGAKFDPTTGEMTNSEEILEAALNKFNNSGRTEKDEEEYNRIKEILDDYEEAHDRMMDEEDKLQEYLDSIMDAKIAKIQYQVEVKIEIEDQKLEYLDYLLSKLEDKEFSAAQSMSKLSEQTQSWLNKYNENVKGLYDTINQLGISLDDAIGIMTGSYTQEQIEALGLTPEQIETIRNYGKEFINIAENLDKLKEAHSQELIDAIQEGIDAFDEIEEKINHVTSTLEHYKNIIDIIGQDTLGVSTEQMLDMMQTAVDSSVASLANAQETLTYLQAQRKAIEDSDLPEDEKNKQLKDIDAKIRDAEASVQSGLEGVLNTIVEQFSTSLELATKEFEKSMSGAFGSLEKLQEAFDRQKEIDNLYVDDYKKIYELTKLTRDINKSIDETDNIKAKQALKDLQKEINDLQKDGTKLSEYDIEMLNKKYELRLAEIALEDAQNAKSQVRMTRDSEGNWSYTYTADENSIAEAEQNYEDKLYAAQEANQEYIKNLQDQIISSYAAMMQAIKQLGPDATQEEINAIRAHYEAIMEAQTQQMENAMSDSNEILGFMKSETEGWINSFDETTLSALTGYQTMEEYQNAFGAATTKMMSDISAAMTTYQTNIKTAMDTCGLSVEDFGKRLETVLNGEGGIKDQIDGLETETTNLVDTVSNNVSTALDSLAGFYSTYSEKVALATAETWGLKEAIQALIDAEPDEPEEEPEPEQDPKPEQPTGPTWSRVKSAYNKIHTGAWGTGAKRYSDGKADGYTEAEIKMAQKLINLVYGGMSMEAAKTKLGFFTGGYTGEWGASGKLAFLHEKELVLNADDTQNMLKSIEMVRAIAQTIDLNSGSTLGWGGLSSMGVGNGKSEIVQDITINAEFPNATDQNEIKAAFDSLFIRASQYANRK